MITKFVFTMVFAIDFVCMTYAQCNENNNWKQISFLKLRDNPVIGGYDVDNAEIFVCRANHERHLIVGKGRIHDSTYYCYVSYDGQEIKKTTFELLLNPPDGYYTWKPIEGPAKPATAIEGGIEASPGQTGGPVPLFIGQCELTAYLVEQIYNDEKYSALVAGHFSELKNIISNTSYSTIISGKVNLYSEVVSVAFNGAEYLCKRKKWPTRLLTCELTTDPKGLSLNESTLTTSVPIDDKKPVTDKPDTGDKDKWFTWMIIAVITICVLLIVVVATCIVFWVYRQTNTTVPVGCAAGRIQRNLSDYQGYVYDDGYYAKSINERVNAYDDNNILSINDYEDFDESHRSIATVENEAPTTLI